MESIYFHLVSGQVLVFYVGLDIAGYLGGSQDTVVRFAAGGHSLIFDARFHIITAHFHLFQPMHR